MTQPVADPGLPAVISAPVGSIAVRPDLFQARDTGAGQSYDDGRVRQIVENWNPERFDPIAVVVHPDDPDGYIVIGGHHRLEAVKRLGIAAVPVRVLSGDITVARERQRLEREAVVSNFGVAESNLRERVHAAGRLSDSGMNVAQVARDMRIRRSEAERLAWLRNLPPGVLERVMVQPELAPVAAELGRAMERHGMEDETVGGLFTRWAGEYEETGKVPGQYVLRQQLDGLAAAQRGPDGEQSGFGALAGFGGDVVLTQFDTERQNAEDLQRSVRGTQQRLTSCETLAAELGIDIEAVRQAARTRLDVLTAEQEESVRRTLTLHRAAATGEPVEPPADHPSTPDAVVAAAAGPDPEPFEQSGPDLFGGAAPAAVAVAPVATVADDPEPEEPPPFVQSGAGLFDSPAAPPQLPHEYQDPAAFDVDGGLEPVATTPTGYAEPDAPQLQAAAADVTAGSAHVADGAGVVDYLLQQAETHCQRAAALIAEAERLESEAGPHRPRRARTDPPDTEAAAAVSGDAPAGPRPPSKREIAAALRREAAAELELAAELVGAASAEYDRLQPAAQSVADTAIALDDDPTTLNATDRQAADAGAVQRPGPAPARIEMMPQPGQGQGIMLATNRSAPMLDITPRHDEGLAADPAIAELQAREHTGPLPGQIEFRDDGEGHCPLQLQRPSEAVSDDDLLIYNRKRRGKGRRRGSEGVEPAVVNLHFR